MNGADLSSDGWRAKILDRFNPQHTSNAPLTIVEDPDQMLGEETLINELLARGYHLVQYEDNVHLRYAYEQLHRRQRDEGGVRQLIVLVRTNGARRQLPYDLIELAELYGQILRFSLARLFPGLSPTVVAEIDRSRYDQVAEAAASVEGERLGDTATKDHLLRHVFGWDPELVKTPETLIAELLKRHYQHETLPESLADRLATRLQEKPVFADWPLRPLVAERSQFFAFLEERWPRFVRSHSERAGMGSEAGAVYNLTGPGPLDVPFDAPEVRVYMDNLFLEGLLAPTSVVERGQVQQPWVKHGVAGEDGSDAADRLGGLAGQLRDRLPEPEAAYGDWLRFAERWAEWCRLRAEVEPDVAAEKSFEDLWCEVDDRFGHWMLDHFTGLHNVAFLPDPVMVHLIPHRMAHRFEGKKVALLVLDGMAWSQWAVLRRELERTKSWEVRHRSVFAWVPTITPVSRQALFAGQEPLFFRQSIHRTSKDESHWRRFWAERGVTSHGVQFVPARSEEEETSFLKRLEAAADHPACRVLGAVNPAIDEMAHGASSSRLLQAAVKKWSEDGHLVKIVAALVDRGFEVHLTSDHGNVEGRGIGRPDVGALVDTRGARVKVFEDPTVRESYHDKYPDTYEWASTGIPEEYFPLLAAGRGAFATAGQRTLSHGGIAIEEVIVPYVRIEGRE